MNNKYWTAFYTRPRCEKKAAERLNHKGFEVYCPTRTVIRNWSDRKKKVKEVIFSSYLFARVDEMERQLIQKDPSIISSVFWLNRPVVIRDEEVESIRAFLSEYSEGTSVSSLEEGDVAAITSGPFRGESGVVIQRNANRVVLQLQCLGLELKAEIAINKLDAVV